MLLESAERVLLARKRQDEVSTLQVAVAACQLTLLWSAVCLAAIVTVASGFCFVGVASAVLCLRHLAVQRCLTFITLGL